MQALLNLRNWLATYSLNKYIASQAKFNLPPTTFSIKNVRTVVVLFDATLPANIELIKKLVSYYKEQGKVIKAIGFVNSKEFEPIILPKSEFEFFSLKEVSFNFTPKTNWHEQFINYTYDLIINADYNNLAPLNYLYAHSTAKFKIGAETPINTKLSIITINIDTEKSLKYFLRHTDHYLQLINA
ncbi:MAG: hypothetical protein H7331_08750 [Bacteroidia bacterium]|nr:hypothetical protein [Bacteroidia bacterium]